MKIIHHWLPPEVRELMLYYLWLVLSFWEKVQILVDANFKSSPFVWGRPAMEIKREREAMKQPVQSGEDEPVHLEEEQPVRLEEEQPVQSGGGEPVCSGDEPVQLEGIETIDSEVYKHASDWKKEWTSARVQGII